MSGEAITRFAAAEDSKKRRRRTDELSDATVQGRTTVVDVGSMVISDHLDEVLVTYSLGSCLGVAVYDPVVRVGGLLHAMLPLSDQTAKRHKDRPCMFMDMGMAALLQALFDRGVRKSRAVVKVVGGAQVLDRGDMFKIGRRYYAVCR